MIKGLAFPKAVVKPDAGNKIFPAVPENLAGRNGMETVIERQDQGHWSSYFLDHKIVYPKKTRSQGIKWPKDAIFNYANV